MPIDKQKFKDNLKNIMKNMGSATKKVLGNLKDNPALKKIEDDINKVGGGL